MQNFRWGLMAAIGSVFISVALGILFDVNAVDIVLRALIFGGVFLGLGFGLRFVLNSFFPEILFPEEETGSVSEQPGANIDITLDSSGEYAVPELYKYDDAEGMGNIEDLISGAFRPGYASNEQESAGKTGFAPVKTSDSIDGRSESGYNDVGYFSDLEAETPGIDDGGMASSFQGFTPLPIEEGGSQDFALFQKPEGAVPVSKQPAGQEQFTPSLGEDSGLGGLPDLDMMARAFSSAYGASMPPPAASASPASSSPLPADEEESPDRSQYKGNKPQALQGDFQAKDIARGLSTLLSKEK